MSLKLNTREMQVKLPGFKAPGLERTAQVHLVRGIQSEREVTWDFGPADVNLGLAEMLRGRMLRSVRGCKSGRSPAGRRCASPALYDGYWGLGACPSRGISFSGGSPVRVRCGCGPVACSLHPGDPLEPLRPLSEAAILLLGRIDVADSAPRRNLHLESLRPASCCLHVDVARNPKLLRSPTRLAHGVLALPPTPPLKCGEPFEYVVSLSGAGAAQSVVEPQDVVPPDPSLALRGTARCSTVTMLRVEPGKFESVSTVQMPGGEVRRGLPGLPAASSRPPPSPPPRPPWPPRDLAGGSP